MIPTAKTKGKHHGEQGFTLVELVITLSVAAIVLALAVPNLRMFILNNRRAAQVNEFVATLQYARTEAVKRGVNVSICKSRNSTVADVPATPRPACQSTTWERGWIVFVDDDGDGVRDGNETLLKAAAELSSDNTLRSNAGIGIYSIIYNPSGAVASLDNTLSPVAPRFRWCDSRGTSESRLIEMTMVGRPRVEGGATACP